MARTTSVTALATVVLLSLISGARVSASDMDGVMMSDGKMMMMKGGKPAGPMDHEMTPRLSGCWENQGYDWYAGV